MLAGRWRLTTDPECSVPAEITVEGRELVVRYAGGVTRQHILDGIGRTIRTRPATAEEGQEARYLIADDGDGFQVNGRGWVRC